MIHVKIKFLFTKLSEVKNLIEEIEKIRKEHPDIDFELDTEIDPFE